MKYFTLLVLLIPLSLACQPKYDYQWVIAANSLPAPGVESLLIDFNNGKRSIIPRDTITPEVGVNNAIICDDNGQILLYANGCEVLNSEGYTIQNGDGINPGYIHDDWCFYGDYPGTRNSMMLPDPSDEKGYYYLHKDYIRYNGDPQWNNQLYSYILENNSSQYEVIQKNVNIDSSRQKVSGYIKAIQHANGSDWWIVDYVQTNEGGVRLLYAIDQDSFYLKSETAYENLQMIREECSSAGQGTFSPDGNRYAIYCSIEGIDLFDFDRETGLFYNHINLPLVLNQFAGGMAFSTNGRFLYLSSGVELHQLDLWESPLINGLIKIGEYDGYLDPFPTNFYKMQIGPDCRIYMTSTNGVSSFHVINNPDEKGLACNFVQHGLDLPFDNNPASIPNIPVYRFDGDEVCDPTITSVFDIPIEVVYDLELYPNPTTDHVIVGFPEDLRDGVLYVKSMNGQVILQQEFQYSGSLRVELGEYDAGIYLIEVVSGGKYYRDRVVKVD